MGLFTTASYSVYRTKSEISCAVSGAVFPPYGEFPYRRGDAGQNYRKNAGGWPMSPRLSKEKVLRHRGGETRVLRPGYVKPKHEFNYQQAVERLPGEDPAQLNDPAYRRLRIITDNLKQEEHAIVQVEEIQAVNAVLWQIYDGRRPVREN